MLCEASGLCDHVCSLLLSRVWLRSLKFYHWQREIGGERVFLWPLPRPRGRERLQYVFTFCESPGGSEILVRMVCLGENVRNQEPRTKARKHEHHRGASTLVDIVTAYPLLLRILTSVSRTISYYFCNHPLITPRL